MKFANSFASISLFLSSADISGNASICSNGCPAKVVFVLRQYAKVVEWYGGKEQFLSVANNPISKEAAESYNQQFDNLLYKLAAKKVCSPDSSEVRELVSEYGFLMKQLSQIKKEHGLMVAQAQYYRNEKIKPMIDEKYGNGTAEFFAQAFEAFYKDK